MCTLVVGRVGKGKGEREGDEARICCERVPAARDSDDRRTEARRGWAQGVDAAERSVPLARPPLWLGFSQLHFATILFLAPRIGGNGVQL